MIIALYLFLSILVLALLIVTYMVVTVYKPKAIELMEVKNRSKKAPKPFQTSLNIVSWNIQFCAGTKRVFFFDVLDGGKKEVMSVDVTDEEETRARIVQLLKKLQPDILLLQEVDTGSRRTHQKNQVELLGEALAGILPYSSSSAYVDAPLHPHIYARGAFKMRLMTLSRFPIIEAKRIALPQLPLAWIDRIFRLQRHLLATRVALGEKRELVVMNTHLEAFTKGSPVLEWQLKALDKEFQRLQKKRIPWIIGGDFNLLPNDAARARLNTLAKTLYNEQSELPWLMSRWAHLPKAQDLKGKMAASYYGYIANNPKEHVLDRTLDYFFYSDQLIPLSYRVLQKEGSEISDHMPFVAEFALKS